MLSTFYINCTVDHSGFTIDNVHNARPIFAAEMTRNGTTYPKAWMRKIFSLTKGRVGSTLKLAQNVTAYKQYMY